MLPGSAGPKEVAPVRRLTLTQRRRGRSSCTRRCTSMHVTRARLHSWRRLPQHLAFLVLKFPKNSGYQI
eukprot:s958_g3.t1